MNKFYGDFSKNVNDVKKVVKSNVEKNNKVKLESYQNKIKYNNTEYSIYIAKYGPVIAFKNDEEEKTKYISLVPYLKATNKDIEDIQKKDVKLLVNMPLEIGKYKSNAVILKYARYGFYLSNGNQNGSVFKQYIPLVTDYKFDEIMKLIKNEKINLNKISI